MLTVTYNNLTRTRREVSAFLNFHNVTEKINSVLEDGTNLGDVLYNFQWKGCATNRDDLYIKTTVHLNEIVLYINMHFQERTAIHVSSSHLLEIIYFKLLTIFIFYLSLGD